MYGMHGQENWRHGGYVTTDGQVIHARAAIAIREYTPAQSEDGVYLLDHGQRFLLGLGNGTERKALLRITGDDDSTVIASSLVLAPGQEAYLQRWQERDETFVAYLRNSAEGQMVGAESVAEGGGGLIKIVFTFGTMEHVTPSYDFGYRSATRGGGEVTRSYGGATRGGYDEGVMGAGAASGQRFGTTSFTADPALPEVEIQLRWAIRRPRAPHNRVVVPAPQL